MTRDTETMYREQRDRLRESQKKAGAIIAKQKRIIAKLTETINVANLSHDITGQGQVLFDFVFRELGLEPLRQWPAIEHIGGYKQ